MAILLAVVGILVAAGFFALGNFLRRDLHDLRRTGVTVEAVVAAKYRAADSSSWLSSDTWIRCVYRETPSGLPHEVSLPVPSKLWNQLSDGGSIQLTVRPDAPETAQPGPRWGWHLRGIVGATLMLFGTTAGAFFLIVAIKR